MARQEPLSMPMALLEQSLGGEMDTAALFSARFDDGSHTLAA